MGDGHGHTYLPGRCVACIAGEWGGERGSLGRRNSMCKGSEAQLLGDQPGSGVR